MEQLKQFEATRDSRAFKSYPWVLAGVQLIILYFFTIIGRFDSSADGQILKNYFFIIALAHTISFSVALCYAGILMNQFVVQYYIGSSRYRLFLYPIGRGELYQLKLINFVKQLFKRSLLGLILANIGYLISESLFSLLDEGVFSYDTMIFLFLSMVVTVIFLLASAVFISLIGLRFQSLVTTIVAAIIVVTTLCNFLVLLMSTQIYLALLFAVLLAILAWCTVGIVAKHLNQLELI